MQDKALMIGGYKSAWLVDLVAAYMLENIQQHFKIMKYFGIYRGNGIYVTNKIMNKHESVKWLINFQMVVKN